MLNVHLVESFVNESVIILHIKPQPKQEQNVSFTQDNQEIGLFVFMNKGKFYFK